ncbi:MAG: 2-hydroxyacid dehydrogenase [Microbacterium sp.]
MEEVTAQVGATRLTERHPPQAVARMSLPRSQERPPHGTVVQVGPLMPFVEQFLIEAYDTVRLPDDITKIDAETRERARIIVTNGSSGVPTDLMDALPRLELVANFGVGYDTTDTVTARARGIRVTNTPDVLTDCVADTALGLLLMTFRRLSAAERFVRRGGWSTAPFPVARRFSGSTIGILGLGRIGTAIAERVAGFGCAVLYHSRHEVPSSPWRLVASLAELATRSDALVVAVPGGSSTENLVDRTVLDALGPDGILINIARGTVVDQDALIDALDEGTLGGAGLDVLAEEPQVPSDLLRDNVVVLPHLGSGTIETRHDMAALTLANVAAYLDGKPLPTPVPESLP